MSYWPLRHGVRIANNVGFLSLLLLGLGSAAPLRAETASTPGRWWSDAVEQSLAQAGTNRAGIVAALTNAPPAQHEAWQFLLENMPARDTRSLSGEFLQEHIARTYEALAQAPWRDRIPKEIFLNDILPYASVTEARENWHTKLRELSLPLITNCTTPAEAAQRLNQKLFPLVKVRYSTSRRSADQAPAETMQTGIATCTGLSILLVDACRSVGVPARVVGTPLWFNKRGNHTWVEIWDGDWHFTGAAEQDPKGLDRGWFGHDASQALKDVREQAIYASSFRKTGVSFPMVWARSADWVSAVNVTDRYTPKTPPAESSKTRLLVKVLDRPAGQRIAATVTVTEATNATAKLTGTSRGETADLNDILPFEVARNRAYEIRVEQDGTSVRREFRAGTNQQELVVISLNNTPLLTFASQVCYVTPPITKALVPATRTKLQTALTEFFAAPAEKQATWEFAADLEKLLRDNEPAVRHAAWEAYRTAPIHTALREDFDKKQVQFEKHLSPYAVKAVGERPTNGWALFIAMHGGGGAPKRVNDSQWEVMQRYYRDHPEVGGYLYVALRAPDDTWNGFYTDYVYPLIANLTRQFLLFTNVDPNKVFIMGYSHGGYGAFAIGPKMPDRFAAIHASAAAPTDGETTAKTLRNTIFTYMVGEKDTAYGRIERVRKFNTLVQDLRTNYPNAYPVTFQEIAGNGHTGLPDRDKIKDMYPAVRNPVPRDLTWLMTDKVIQDFFWLYDPKPGKQQEIEAICRDNKVTVTTSTNVAAASVLLDRRLVDFEQPVTLVLNGQTTTQKLTPSLRTLCATLLRRGDPELAFTAQLELPLGR